MPILPTNDQQLAFAKIADRLGTYVSRRNANFQNQRESVHAAVDPTYTPFYNAAAYFKPHATVDEYVEEPNSGPKDGFRPIYFFDLDRATTPTVTVTINGLITVPAADTFSLVAASIDPALPLDQFLAAVVAGITPDPDLSLTVERTGTCLGIVGNIGVEIDNVQVVIS